MEQPIPRDISADLEALAGMTIGCKAEYDNARVILVKRPGLAYAFGALTIGGLFDGKANARIAAAEHLEYQEQLRRIGAVVLDVRDVLLHGTIQADGRPREGNELEALRKLAYQFITYAGTQQTRHMTPKERERVEYQKIEGLAVADPRDIATLIFLSPDYRLDFSDRAGLHTEDEMLLAPVSNMIFMRDPFFVTDKGAVLCSMRFPERRRETEITRFVLQKMGVPIIYETGDDGNGGTIEGGDFMPAGVNSSGQTYAYIGQGARTNAAAIHELVMNNGSTVFGYDLIAVVKDPWKQQDEMHFDTYANIPARGVLAVLEDRITPGNPKMPVVDVYERQSDGSYRVKEVDTPFPDFLKEMGVEEDDILRVPKHLQERYALNFLTVADSHVIGVDIAARRVLQAQLNTTVRRWNAEPSRRYKAPQYESDLDTMVRVDHSIFGSRINRNLLDFTHLNQGYGASHCLANVLVRGN
jgi:arginine deiminase